jgi:hypothetical protein
MNDRPPKKTIAPLSITNIVTFFSHHFRMELAKKRFFAFFSVRSSPHNGDLKQTQHNKTKQIDNVTKIDIKFSVPVSCLS